MAYVRICDPCMEGRHEECEPSVGEGYGAGLCVCAHGAEESAFQRSVREGMEKKRREDDD